MTAHHQQHDETTNPGMVRGAAGARRASGHGRNDLDHDTPVCSRGGFMTMCSNDRLGRFANRSSHQFKSARSRGFLPLALVTQRAAGFPARYRPCPNSPSVQSLLNAGNLGAFVAAHFLFGLSQNDPYHRVQSAPCHVVKRLSCGSAKRQQTTTMEGRKNGIHAQGMHHV